MYVGLVDNDVIARTALRNILNDAADIEVLWDVADGFSAWMLPQMPSIKAQTGLLLHIFSPAGA